MDRTKPEPGDEGQAEKALPRGLEQVSHLFLRPSAPIAATSQGAERSTSTSSDPVQTIVVRPSRFLGRDSVVALLRTQTAALEEGVRSIDTNIPCDIGAIDLLALDRANQLTIIDVDDHPGEGLLLRGVAHFDWIMRNTPNLRRMFPGHVINFSAPPRLMLVAPEFSPLFLCVSRHIASPQVMCWKYHTMAVTVGFAIMFERVRSFRPAG